MKGEPSEEGRRQFLEYETNGISPEHPDPFYLRLSDGKKWFDWQNTELRSLYHSEEWWGWYTLYEDYRKVDELWILEKLTKWGRKVMPDWLIEQLDEAAKKRHEYETQKFLDERAERLKVKYDSR